jgi:ankyrin repeat protein
VADIGQYGGRVKKTELPPDPDLELLRKQAKELLRAARRGEAEALSRLRATVPRLERASRTEVIADLRLADAQHAIAVEHGFASWPKLKRHIEDAQPLGRQVERFLAAVRERNATVASQVLARYPEVGRANIFTACCIGAAELVAEMLAAEPALATTVHPPENAVPLLYLCGSTFHHRNPQGFLRCAELLLAHGADPNSHILWDGDPHAKLPALYFACVAGNVPIVKLLLERGAEPNDGESIYHAAELNRRECLELLLAHGGDIGSRHPHWNNTPLYFLAGYRESDANRVTATEGMRWLLEHGADPNVTSHDKAETALHHIAAAGRSVTIAEMLLAHGAEVDQPRADGRTAYVLALRAGNTAVADLLLEKGADTTLAAPVDELLGACMWADEAMARSLLARHPMLISQLTDEDRMILAQAAEQGREASVRLMFELGFDLRWEGHGCGTPLHHAAWHGRPSMVRLLLELGAPVNVRDSQFGGSPIGWAGHGSVHCRKADDDYLAVIELLIAAGADREMAINRWRELPESMGSRRVNARLRAWAEGVASKG